MVLDCKYSMKATYGANTGEFRHDNSYTCSALVKYECDADESYIVGVTRQHSPEKTRFDVKNLLFEGFKTKVKLIKIPSQIGEFFPKLETLDVSFCEIEFVTKNDFLHLPFLRIIHLSGNNLKFLASDLFLYTPDVEFISFDYNKIRSVGTNLLNGLMKLREVFIHNNLCTVYVSPCNILQIKKVLEEKCVVKKKQMKQFYRKSDRDDESIHETSESHHEIEENHHEIEKELEKSRDLDGSDMDHEGFENHIDVEDFENHNVDLEEQEPKEKNFMQSVKPFKKKPKSTSHKMDKQCMAIYEGTMEDEEVYQSQKVVELDEEYVAEFVHDDDNYHNSSSQSSIKLPVKGKKG